MIYFQQIKSKLLLLRAILAKTKELQGMKQELKLIRIFLWRIHFLNRATLQPRCFSTVNTSQMMDISFNWGIENLTCWKMSRTNQSLLYEYLKIPIYRRQAHGIIPLMQLSMQFLPTQFICTFFKFIKHLFLTFSYFGLDSAHFQDLHLTSFNDDTEYLT